MFVPIVHSLGTGGTAGTQTGIFYVSSYVGADPTGVTDSTDAFEAAMADAIAYADAHSGATIHLGGSENTWRIHPRKRSERGSLNQVFNYPVALLFVSTSGITITGASAGSRPLILMDAAPEIDGGSPPRDPADKITRRGEFLHLDDCQNFIARWFRLDGQAPITYAANNWGLPEEGWDFSHKGAVVQYGSDNVQFIGIDMENLRSEFIYANGDLPYVGTILIDGGTWKGTTASMFSCTASLTVRNLTVRECPQGIENYAYTDMITVVENCDVDSSYSAIQDYESLNATLSGGVYEIVDNSGGADWTNVGAPNNDVGTFFSPSSTSIEPTSWGTGSLRRYASGHGIVIFNQRGTGTVAIRNTTVKNSNTGVLITDFAHHWTIEDCTFEDVDAVFGLSNQNTSSTSSDFHRYAGWRDFTISGLTVRAINKNVPHIFSAGGANQQHTYVLGPGTSSSPSLAGYYVISDFNHNGRHRYAKQTPATGELPEIIWTGSAWEIVENGTVYYRSTDDAWVPADVTTWVAVSGAAPVPVVTQHIPRDWTIDDLVVVEENGFSVQRVFYSQAGWRNTSVSNSDLSEVTSVQVVGNAYDRAFYIPSFDPATVQSSGRTINLGTDAAYRPLWDGEVITLSPNPSTVIDIVTDYNNYMPDGFRATFRSNLSSARTVFYPGVSGLDSVNVTNTVPATLVFDSATGKWSEL